MVRAFSLVELVMVVVILGVIGAIAVPRLSGLSERAKEKAAAATARAVQEKVVEYAALEGKLPTAIELNWFAGGVMPKSPYASGTDPRGVQVVNGGAGVTEPTLKVVSGGARPYWYNRESGAFRVRVKAGKTAGETLALYNAVNGTDVGDMSSQVSQTGLGDTGNVDKGG